jgi:hypothetical protein
MSSSPSGQPPPSAAPAEPARSYVAGILTAGLAAVCGAVFTSWAGVQGTLVGAMVGATIGSSVSEVVRAPLTTLEQRIIQAGVSARRLRRDGVTKTILSSPAAAGAALREVGSCLVSRNALIAVATVAVLGFGLALSGITAVEAATGEPLAAIVSDSAETGTTIGNVVPNPPPILAPAPTSPSAQNAGRGDDGAAVVKPGDPGTEGGLPADVPGRVTGGVVPPSPSTAASSETPQTDPAVAASPDASATAGASATSTGTVTPDGTATPATASASKTATATGSATVVKVVTVVVTATPTSSPANGTSGPTQTAPVATTAPANAPSATSAPTSVRAATPTSTPTPTRTPTPTATSTRTPTPAPAAPTAAPPTPPSAPQG